jgi:rsbT co-antagonist protein RsbR
VMTNQNNVESAVPHSNEPYTRILELERRINDLQQQMSRDAVELERLRAKADDNERVAGILRVLADNIPDWVFVKDRDHRYRFVNRSYAASLRREPDDMLGKNDIELGFPEYNVKGDPERGIRGFWADDRQVMESGEPLIIPRDIATLDGEEHIFFTSKLPLKDAQGGIWGVLVLCHDVTEQNAASEAKRRSIEHEALIAAQQAAIRELSTPLIPVADGIVVMPIIGTVESTRALQIMETLLTGITQYRAHTALLDITGVKIIDTQIAAALVRAAQSARLLGADVILTGISPEVAQTLVHIGADLSALKTHSSLQRGIAYALQRQR